jgi:hypothetical protein
VGGIGIVDGLVVVVMWLFRKGKNNYCRGLKFIVGDWRLSSCASIAVAIEHASVNGTVAQSWHRWCVAWWKILSFS